MSYLPKLPDAMSLVNWPVNPKSVTAVIVRVKLTWPNEVEPFCCTVAVEASQVLPVREIATDTKLLAVSPVFTTTGTWQPSDTSSGSKKTI